MLNIYNIEKQRDANSGVPLILLSESSSGSRFALLNHKGRSIMAKVNQNPAPAVEETKVEVLPAKKAKSEVSAVKAETKRIKDEARIARKIALAEIKNVTEQKLAEAKAARDAQAEVGLTPEKRIVRFLKKAGNAAGRAAEKGDLDRAKAALKGALKELEAFETTKSAS